MTIQQPIFDITFTAYNGVAVTLLRTSDGKWMADIGSGIASIGPLPWTALVRNIEFCLSDRNKRFTLKSAKAEG